MLKVAERFGQERGHVRVEELVLDMPPRAATGHQPEIPQDPQLMGDGRLLHLDGGTQDADGAAALAQAGQDAHPAGGGQGSHQPGDALGG
jgi:hypothetical protein